MKFKVRATYYVEAPSWTEAEQRVEQKLIDTDQIDSEPADKTARDMVMYGISTKIYNEHNQIFFDPNLDKTYEEKLEILKTKTGIWLENLLEEIVKSNEQSWV